MKIQARRLLDIHPDDLLNWITGSFTLVFDDGEIKTNAKETLISSYFWDYHRTYPELRLLSEHHIHYHLKGNRLKNKTHLSLIGKIVDEWYRVFGNHYTNDDKLKMLNIGYSATNEYYNKLSILSSDYFTSVDITDLYQLVTNPVIKDIKENGDYSQRGVKEIHKNIIQTVLKDDSLKDNMIAKQLRSGLIKDSQLVQCIGPFGYPKDIDDYIFKHPIKRGYIEGLRSFYDSATESRTASMALHFAKSHLKRVEYFSRKAQLVGMNLQTVHRGDCKSEFYIPWEITSQGDLDRAHGIYILDDDKILKPVTPDMTHLIGKVVKMRNIVGCMHDDPNGCCEVCYGQISRNIVEGTNVGQQSGITMTSDNSQNVLSTKHVISSGIVAKLVLKENQLKFFKVSPDGMGYMLNPSFNKEGSIITLDHRSMLNITSILNMKDISKISTSRATDIKQVKMLYLVSDKNGEKEYRQEDVSLEFQSRRAYASREFLEYMKNNKWEVNNRGHYEIDLSNWDYNQVMFKCPPKQFSTVDFSKGISDILEAKVREQATRDLMNPIDFMKDFVEYISQNMNIPTSVLIAIAYGYMIVSHEKLDYSLPKPGTDKGVGVLIPIMMYRSLGAAMAFQSQNELLMNPQTFLNTNRPDHVFDWMLLPQEVRKVRQ